MKIQLLANGLANQIRYYVFVRFAERCHPGEQWFFDDSFFFASHAHNGYELERVFGLKLNLLSNYFDADVWDKIVQLRAKGIIFPQILLDMGIPIVMFEGRLNGYQEPFSGEVIIPDYPHLGFHSEYIDLPHENIYYHADWSSKKWFSAYEQENLSELVFPQLPDKRNLEYGRLIRESFSVGIHIRRGAFLDDQIGGIIPSELYFEACKKVLSSHPDAHFFIFSDELDWCQEHEKELGFDLSAHTTYISGNCGEKCYVDMQLLSMCRGIIRNAESSFSQVAGWLDRNLTFEIKLKGSSSESALKKIHAFSYDEESRGKITKMVF